MLMNANDVVLHMQISHASVPLPFCVKESHSFVDVVVYRFIFEGALVNSRGGKINPNKATRGINIPSFRNKILYVV